MVVNLRQVSQPFYTSISASSFAKWGQYFCFSIIHVCVMPWTHLWWAGEGILSVKCSHCIGSYEGFLCLFMLRIIKRQQLNAKCNKTPRQGAVGHAGMTLGQTSAPSYLPVSWPRDLPRSECSNGSFLSSLWTASILSYTPIKLSIFQKGTKSCVF